MIDLSYRQILYLFSSRDIMSKLVTIGDNVKPTEFIGQSSGVLSSCESFMIILISNTLDQCLK